MTNKSLRALEARLEAAMGSSRELDAFIEDEIGVSSEYPGLAISKCWVSPTRLECRHKLDLARCINAEITALHRLHLDRSRGRWLERVYGAKC